MDTASISITITAFLGFQHIILSSSASFSHMELIIRRRRIRSCAYSANVVSKDLDIFTIAAVNLKLLILVAHNANVLHYFSLVNSNIRFFVYLFVYSSG
jgi:hypothetical protein